MYPRSDWGARPPRQMEVDSVPKRTMVIHHSDFLGAAIQTRAQQREAMRGIQNYHMDHNGWSDIGYDIVVFQPEGPFRISRVYEGRPMWAVPAAQLGHNSGTIPVCVVGNFQIEGVKVRTLVRLEAIARNLVREHGITTVKGHRDFMSTDCPGDHLYPYVKHLQAVVDAARRGK